MIHKEESGSVYLFGYDSVFDCPGLFDEWYETIEKAERVCQDVYGIGKNDWINIADPLENCQQDFIMPVRVKGREEDKPQWGHVQILLDGKWVSFMQPDKNQSLNGMTLKERLFMTGLAEEFDYAMWRDKSKAMKILKALRIDSCQIEKILRK